MRNIEKKILKTKIENGTLSLAKNCFITHASEKINNYSIIVRLHTELSYCIFIDKYNGTSKNVL